MFGIIVGLFGIGLVTVGILCLLVDSSRRDDTYQRELSKQAKREEEKAAV